MDLGDGQIGIDIQVISHTAPAMQKMTDAAKAVRVGALGLDRIMFSVGYPFAEIQPATEWLHRVPLWAEDQAKLAGVNARRLLKL